MLTPHIPLVILPTIHELEIYLLVDFTCYSMHAHAIHCIVLYFGGAQLSSIGHLEAFHETTFTGINEND